MTEGTSGPGRRTGARRTVRIGLTGPIACGKSTVARWLAEAGAATVDADSLAREATAPGSPVLPAIAARFGAGVMAPDGSLDRAALGRLVFGDPAALADLERIVHPAVRPLLLAAVAAAEARSAPAVVVEAIKLVEAGYAAECDEVWLVVCSEAEQRARLVERGADPGDADRRMRAQAGTAARLAPAATRIIDTSGDAAAARRTVLDAYEGALARGGEKGRSEVP